MSEKIKLIQSLYSAKDHRLYREPFLSHLTGYEALLMQFAHPAVAHAGVNHSYAASDLSKRAFSTYKRISQLFLNGNEQEQRAAAGEINEAHKNSGVPAALNPKVIEWVWATVIDAIIKGHQKFIGPLDEEIITKKIIHSRDCASLIGLKTDIETEADLRGYIDSMIESGRVRVGENARELARAIYDPTQRNPITRVAGKFAFQLAASLLPVELVKQYNLPWLEPLNNKTMLLTQGLWKTVIPPITAKLVGT